MGLIFLLLLIAALAASAMGFKNYIWFISIGYGVSIAALSAVLMIVFHARLTGGTVVLGVLLILYGCRLAGYLAAREAKGSSYQKAMKGEVKDGSSVKIPVKICIWITVALLYECQVSPMWFRLYDHGGTDGFAVVGAVIMAAGILVEITADVQKNRAKQKNPGRFVDTGLYRLVRCPNYLGELMLWTGVFVSGVNVFRGPLQWILALCGFGGIVYVMFSGARRLEVRQTKNYGDDPEYQAYMKKTPIMIPFVPLYSVAKHKWLAA